ncbi:RimJ/RimL family protein N-acetyltransferase [Sphingomonas zeicaulis]|uniref:GNAT family N-acetyltransferase n=1 Tax=Sphingomonas zeicaulis TaxID=1632740 RepID=UPI003D23DE8B
MILAAAIETPRLVIRPFEPSDAPVLVALFADPQVYRFVGDGGPLSAADAALWVERSRVNLELHGFGTGAVVRRSGGAPIGWAGFARPGDGSEEIIYGLGAAHWGQGFGGELLDALIAIAVERGIAPLRATVDPANAASIRLLTRRGFRLAERRHGGDPDTDLYLL